jgi:hypothetical protein
MMPMVSCQDAQLLQDVESSLSTFSFCILSPADGRVTMFDGHKMFNQVIRSAIRSIESPSSQLSILPIVASQDALLLQDVPVDQTRFSTFRPLPSQSAHSPTAPSAASAHSTLPHLQHSIVNIQPSFCHSLPSRSFYFGTFSTFRRFSTFRHTFNIQ